MSHPDGLSYDQVPYPSLSHANTHPDSLATMAILAGLHPAPVENCRVLELGSASGGNLIPMAYALPNSQFFGIDISRVQIEQGLQKVQELRLSNLNLEQMDILDFPDDLGTFDYIIAHGIFSWVPTEVREKLLDIYRTHLAPDGVGFISYNTYPGWYRINIARDIMRYNTRGIDDPKERVAQARAALHFYANTLPDENNAYLSFLKFYSDYINGNDEDKNPKYDSALLHDELEELNQPFYFHQFNELVEQHGLRFLADLCHFDQGSLPPETSEILRKKSKNLIEFEQAQDFLKNRTFRQTLVCQKEARINRKLTPEIVKNFYIASQAQPVSEIPQEPPKNPPSTPQVPGADGGFQGLPGASPDYFSVSVEKFRGQDGAILTTDHPCSKIAMQCLAEVWPRSIAFPDLLASARARMKQHGLELSEEAVDAKVLGVNILRAFGYSSTLIELHCYAPALDNRVGDRPVASRVASYQAIGEIWVTNLRHERVTPDELERYLLTCLDGTKDRLSIINSLKEGPLADGTLTVEIDGKTINLAEQPELISSELELRLEWLAKAGLFIDPARLGA